MQQLPRHRITIPSYSLGEELINAISHGAGALLGIVALVLCMISALQTGSSIALVAVLIYGSSLIVLYTISALYHAFKVNKAKRVFRVIDHCSIFLLIAGTYTPYALVSLGGTMGWIMFSFIWIIAIIGVVLNAVNIRRYRALSMILYLAMGWSCIFVFEPLAKALGPQGIWFLLGGGIVYTIGTIFYGFGRKIKYMHSIFHFFVLAGSILHFLSIYFYVL